MSGTTTDSSSFSGERVLGRVKWFNNRAGFGFISVLEGEKTGEDVFTHHSGISVESEQYKYLVQGEYVEFELRASDNEEHPYQAGNVRGVKGGMLMCETRMAMRRDNDKGGDYEGRRPRQGRNDRNDRNYKDNDRRAQPRRGGGGPRDGEWTERKPRGKWNVKPTSEDQ
jgi:cold shock CspA family protein